jgi:hypothetical protein
MNTEHTGQPLVKRKQALTACNLFMKILSLRTVGRQSIESMRDWMIELYVYGNILTSQVTARLQ